MSKVLVVQPDRMLRQAFTLALFPEHEVEMLHGLPGAAPTGVDAVIVDGAALKEFNSITAGELGAIQSWKVPMVWIDNEAASLADRETLVRLNRPVTKAGLQKALEIGRASCRERV